MWTVGGGCAAHYQNVQLAGVNRIMLLSYTSLTLFVLSLLFSLHLRRWALTSFFIFYTDTYSSLVVVLKPIDKIRFSCVFLRILRIWCEVGNISRKTGTPLYHLNKVLSTFACKIQELVRSQRCVHTQSDIWKCAAETERLQATSAIDTQATANEIQHAVTMWGKQSEKKMRRVKEIEPRSSQRNPVLHYS